MWEIYAVQDLLRSGTLERWERVIVQERLLPYLHAQTSLLRSKKESLKASSSAVRALRYSLGDVRGWKDLAASRTWFLLARRWSRYYAPHPSAAVCGAVPRTRGPGGRLELSLTIREKEVTR